ncbi:hypothetical protein ACJMK2_012137 [Sinanodonta woodiana]|uniref:Uncharacterized protein n=1 Tax=Sinanodonta woodiana TaxID=1069815 RepID=A0ABD3V9J3_SINWO
MCETNKMEDTTKEKCCRGNELYGTVILSLAFTFIFTAYLAIQNLQSSLNQVDGLGMISLSCLYATIIVSGILAPAIIRAIGVKWCLIASFICHIIYTGTNFYPTFATLVPSSVLLGITAGPMWTGQSVYIANKAFSYAQRANKDPHAILSFYNGIFFCMYETTQITGNIISSVVLHQGTYNMTNNTLCGKDDCPIVTNSSQIEEPERYIVYTLLGVFLGCDFIGLLISAFLLPPLSPLMDDGNQDNVRQSLISCGKALGDLDLVFLVPLTMFMAMEQAILWTDFTKSFISCPFGIQQIGFIMAAYGGSTTVFALLFSRLAEYSGRYVLFGIAAVINMAIFISLFFFNPSMAEQSYIFIIAVIWGASEGIWQTQSNALIAFLFPEKKESAFANYHTWKAIGFTITFVYGNFLCVSSKLYIAIVLLFVAMLLYAIVEIRVRRSRGSQDMVPFRQHKSATISQTVL